MAVHSDHAGFSIGGNAVHELLSDSKYLDDKLINPFRNDSNWELAKDLQAANTGIKWKIGDSDSYVSINLDDLHFGLGGNIDSPCSLGSWVWDPVGCLKKIHAYAEPNIKLGGSLKLEIGDQTGSFKLAKKNLIPSEGVTFPTIPGISAGGKFKTDFEADIVVDDSNKNKTYDFSFDVVSDNRFDLSVGNGFQIKPIKNDVNAHADPITGLKFGASILPTLSAVIEIGETLPVVGDIDLASINGDIIPKETIEVASGSGKLEFDVLAGASADFLKVPIFHGFHFDIAQTSLYSTSVDLW